MGPVGAPAVTGSISVPRLWIVTSVLVAALVAIASLCGILLPQTYARETTAWALQAMGQDYANLGVAVLLLVSTYLVRARSVRGYLVWLGALLFLVFVFVIAAFTLHFQFLFLAYVAVLGLSSFTLVGGLTAGGPGALAPALKGNPSAKAASVFLFVIGGLFTVVWLSEIIPSTLAGTTPASLVETALWVNPVQVLDLAFVLPGMIIAAVLLWKGDSLGEFVAAPLLVFATVMGIGIIVTAYLSAVKGLPFSVPPVAIFGIISVLGLWLSWRFLSGVTET